MSTAQFLILYALVINILTWIVFGNDKHKAVNHEFRVPEATLFLLALIGGSIGALVGMIGFHHKTRKWKFRIGMPAILLLQVGAAAFLVTHFSVSVR